MLCSPRFNAGFFPMPCYYWIMLFMYMPPVLLATWAFPASQRVISTSMNTPPSLHSQSLVLQRRRRSTKRTVPREEEKQSVPRLSLSELLNQTVHHLSKAYSSQSGGFERRRSSASSESDPGGGTLRLETSQKTLEL